MLISPAPPGSGASRVLSPTQAPEQPARPLPVARPTQGLLFTTPASTPPEAVAVYTSPIALPAVSTESADVAQVATCVYLSQRGTAITSSRDVARIFGKEHKHVLRDIRAVQAELLDIDSEDTPPCFADHAYRDTNNQSRPEILMTQRGFMLLAMGFTGREAMRFKVAFLDAFEALKAQVQTVAPAPSPASSYQPISKLAQLPYYTRADMQVEVVKQTATYVLEQTRGNKSLLVRHHRVIMKTLTGLTPSQYREARLQEGNKVRSFSGRELLRRYEPAKAAVAAVFDDCVRLGLDVETLADRNIAHTLEPAFASMLALGVDLADLESAA